MTAVVCQRGFPEALRWQAASLYDAAFGAKLAVAMPDAAQRLRVLAACLQPDHAFAAVSQDSLLGLAGFKLASGSLTSGIRLRTLFQQLGPVAGLRAALVLSLYDRRPSPGELLMDGIAVAPSMRGAGIGTQLLHALEAHGRQIGCTSLRLDVIDTNPGARRLYARLGFVETRTTSFASLRWLLGFGATTTMVLPLPARQTP